MSTENIQGFHYPLKAKTTNHGRLEVTDRDGERLFTVREEADRLLVFEFGDSVVKLVPVAFNRFNVEIH
jgi:hypothetical protein